MSELNDLFYQLPSPVLLLGVFNGTTTQWDFSSSNPRGNLDAKFINKNDLCLLIYSSPTFLHSSKGSYSNLDLTLTFLSIRWNYNCIAGVKGSSWQRQFPILLLSSSPVSFSEQTPLWRPHEPDWTRFQTLCIKHFLNFSIQWKLSQQYDTAHLSLLQTSGNYSAHQKPWFEYQCKEAVK